MTSGPPESGRRGRGRQEVGSGSMLYSAYQAQSDLLQPISALARSALAGYRFWSGLSWTGLAETGLWRNIAASWEMLGRAGLDHERPCFGIDSVLLKGRRVAVREERILATPFATLLHFRKAAETVQPRV